MTDKSKIKIGIIVLIMLSISFFNGLADIQKQNNQSYESEIEQLKKQLDIAKNTITVDRKGYSSNLRNIVKHLYNDEVFGIGGSNVPVRENMDKLYNAIMDYSTNFNSLLNNVNNYFNRRDKFKKDIPDIFPVRYDKSIRITSGFGMRYSPISGKLIFHKGIDIIASGLPTPIIATADGIVTDVWIYHPVYGKMVKIKHKYGFVTLYAHMKRTVVHEGWKVKKGQIIGYMGATGEAHGRHVHYEIWKNGELKNPVDYLRGME